ncbi:MAG: hypothetical protein JW892_01225 [Anaerolineae bacterium]|nr:hypothetical protein [Anaerolineae bacterium]
MKTQTTSVGTKIIGAAQEAEGWILASNLSPEMQASLVRFVRRFPALHFEKWQPGHRLPGAAALHAIWNVLYGVHTSELRWMQFDTPDAYSDIHETPAAEIWYHGFLDASPSSEYERVFMDGQQLLFLGYWECSGETTYYLALKVDDEQDGRVYVINYEDISLDMDDESIGRIAAGRVREAFDSYAVMLGHIVALRLGETVVTAIA